MALQARAGSTQSQGTRRLGLRLPLASLPTVDPKDYPHIVPLDPYEDRGPLPDFSNLHLAPEPHAPAGSSARGKVPIVRTALSVEPRDGVLYVFMPPISRLEDYLELVAQLEAAADGLPVRIEGYPPPDDLRMGVLKVTPDPCVIEVNVHPAAKLARDGRHRHRRLRGRPGWSGWAPTSS